MKYYAIDSSGNEKEISEENIKEYLNSGHIVHNQKEVLNPILLTPDSDSCYARLRNGEWHRVDYIPNSTFFNFKINDHAYDMFGQGRGSIRHFDSIPLDKHVAFVTYSFMQGILLKHINDLKRICLSELRRTDLTLDAKLQTLDNLKKAEELEKDIYGP